MQQPRYSALLSSKRRELGLSLAQAARVLRLKPEVLEAFEAGEWERIPRSGYAQGMLSSYARYLGLNSREVIQLFEDDLALYSTTQARSPRTRPSPARTSGDLYGSEGPAGSILTTSVFDSTGPQPITYRSKAQNRYNQELTSAGKRQTTNQRLASSAGVTGQMRRVDTGRVSSRRVTRTANRNAAQEISRRTAATQNYEDDLRYDQALPYESSATPQGRRAMHNSVSPARPRRTVSQTRGITQQPQKKQGLIPAFIGWFLDSRHLVFTLFVLLGIILLLLITLALQSCSTTHLDERTRTISVETSQQNGAQNSADATGSTSSADAQSASTTNSGATSAGDTNATAQDSAAQANVDAAAGAAEQPTQTDVVVSVADGEVSWLEIKNGDTTVLAQTVTGPWTQTFTVDTSLTVRANDPSVVSVTANGKNVKFETMASGIGTATVVDQTQQNAASTAQNTAGASSN